MLLMTFYNKELMTTTQSNRTADSLKEISSSCVVHSLALSAQQSNPCTDKSNVMSDHIQVAKRLRALIDSIPAFVVVLDQHGLVNEFNASVPELLGDDINGKLWRDVVSAAFLPKLDQGELQTPDGRQFTLSTKPLGYEPGQIVLLTEVTQTRQLQKAAQQNIHLINMGKMIASLAHQIRTPLASTLLYLSQLAEGNLNKEKTDKFINKSLDRTKHIEKMINDMLMFSHGGQFKMSEFLLIDLLSELNEQIQPLFKPTFAQLKIRQFDANISLNGNKNALVGAFANLCMNALQQASEDLVVILTINTTPNGLIQIAIQDNAGGMDELTQKHLFDPFYTTKSDGTGLGLAVVKSVVESHQGNIAVNSKLGQGTVFVMSLPSQSTHKKQVSKD